MSNGNQIFSTSNYIRLKQTISWFISVIVILGLLYLSIRTNTKHYWYLTLTITIIIALLNWILSRLFDIKISKTEISIENLYLGKGLYELSEFNGIKDIYSYVPFLNPFVSPPYYRLMLKNGKDYIFYDDSIKSFASVFNKTKQSKVINDRILEVIAQREQ